MNQYVVVAMGLMVIIDEMFGVKAGTRSMSYSDVFYINWLNVCRWDLAELPFLNSAYSCD